MKTTNKVHYVYKITNLNPTDERLYYIGVHSDKNPDSLNDGYMGSSKYLDEAMKLHGKENFKKEILSTWNTREEATSEEIKLHNEFDVAKNKLYYNKSKAKSTGFDVSGLSFTKGLIPVVDLRNNSTKRIMKKDYENNDYYKFITSGTVLVVDIRDNLTKRVNVDEYKINENYISINMGKVSVIDIRDNSTKQVSKEDYNNFDYYISCMKKTITVYDIRDNKTKKVSTDDYHLYNYYKSKDSKHYKIYSEKGIVQFEVFGVFKKFCEENGLPYDSLMNSYKHNGKPLYQSSHARSIKPEYIKYKGWYALEE